ADDKIEEQRGAGRDAGGILRASKKTNCVGPSDGDGGGAAPDRGGSSSSAANGSTAGAGASQHIKGGKANISSKDVTVNKGDGHVNVRRQQVQPPTGHARQPSTPRHRTGAAKAGAPASTPGGKRGKRQQNGSELQHTASSALHQQQKQNHVAAKGAKKGTVNAGDASSGEGGKGKTGQKLLLPPTASRKNPPPGKSGDNRRGASGARQRPASVPRGRPPSFQPDKAKQSGATSTRVAGAAGALFSKVSGLPRGEGVLLPGQRGKATASKAVLGATEAANGKGSKGGASIELTTVSKAASRGGICGSEHIQHSTSSSNAPRSDQIHPGASVQPKAPVNETTSKPANSTNTSEGG
ncbi:unnamed protein product, partial [Amoebophrya sp. A25]